MEPDRLRSLDGLRGIAALVVVFHHLSLTAPGPAAIVLQTTTAHPQPGSVGWLLFSTPLSLLVAGPEAVVVFFVLSGLVLVRSVGPSPRSYDWYGYYPRRLSRLGIPVAAAVIFAALVVVVTRQDPRHSASPWVSSFSIPDLTPQRVVAHLDLIWGDIAINNPIWSLHYELIFSALLPVFVMIARWARGSLLVVASAMTLTSLGVLSGSGALSFLPMFLGGAMLIDLVPRARNRLARMSKAAATGVLVGALVAALVLIELRWVLWSVGAGVADAQIWGFPATLLGAMILVALVLVASPLQRALQLRPVRFLGTISFSLYLVHVPIIIGTANVLSGRPLMLSMGVALVVSLIVATVFAKVVEMPAHRLSRRLARPKLGELVVA